MRAGVGAVLSAVFLGACGAGGGVGTAPELRSNDGITPVTLSSQQRGVVEVGVRHMVSDSNAMIVGEPTAFTKPGRDGTQVCGHVRSGAGGTPGSHPFYLELRDAAGQPTAERGQVGSDKAKQAKVKFMCRFVAG